MTGRPSDFQYYKKYKKPKDVTAQNILTVFTTTFLIMLIFFIGAAKKITPSVDVSIGEETTMEAKDTGLGVKGFIDNRLKAIQSEDSLSAVKRVEQKLRAKFDEDDEDEYYSKDLEEKVKIPDRIVRQEVKENKEPEPVAVAAPIVKPTPTPKPVETVSSPAPVPVSVKVVVGNYTSIEQAKVAQSILQEANLDLAPFIKNIGGSYTLQVGSFSSEAKAQSLANELIKNNFPARLIKN